MRVFLLADVAVVEFTRFAGFGRIVRYGREEEVGRGEDGFAAQGANAGLVEYGDGSLGQCFTAGAFRGSAPRAAEVSVGIVDLGNGAVEAAAIFGGKAVEEAFIAIDGFEEFRGGAKLTEQVRIGLVERGRGYRGAGGHSFRFSRSHVSICATYEDHAG